MPTVVSGLVSVWDQLTYAYNFNVVFPATAVVLPKFSIVLASSYNSGTGKVALSFLSPVLTQVDESTIESIVM